MCSNLRCWGLSSDPFVYYFDDNPIGTGQQLPGTPSLLDEGELGRVHDPNMTSLFLANIAARCGSLCRLYDMGESTGKNKLWVMELGSSLVARHDLRPAVKLVANIHGTDHVGREMLLYLVDDLVSAYATDARVRRILDTTHIHVMPSMNPDGARVGVLENLHGGAPFVDLDKNFDDRFDPAFQRSRTRGSRERGEWSAVWDVRQEIESKAIVEWTNTQLFDLSLDVRGGPLGVVLYPFSSCQEPRPSTVNGSSSFDFDAGLVHCLTADEEMFQSVGANIARAHARIAGNAKSGSYFGWSCAVVDGVAQRAEIQAGYGRMQDWNYYRADVPELVLQLPLVSPLDANAMSDTLATLWAESRGALLTFLEQADRGIKGTVADAGDPSRPLDASITVAKYPEGGGAPVVNGRVTHTQAAPLPLSRDSNNSAMTGAFFRILPAGTAPSGGSSSNTTLLVAIIVAAGTVCLVLAALLGYCCWRRHHHPSGVVPIISIDKDGTVGISVVPASAAPASPSGLSRVLSFHNNSGVDSPRESLLPKGGHEGGARNPSPAWGGAGETMKILIPPPPVSPDDDRNKVGVYSVPSSPAVQSGHGAAPGVLPQVQVKRLMDGSTSIIVSPPSSPKAGGNAAGGMPSGGAVNPLFGQVSGFVGSSDTGGDAGGSSRGVSKPAFLAPAAKWSAQAADMDRLKARALNSALESDYKFAKSHWLADGGAAPSEDVVEAVISGKEKPGRARGAASSQKQLLPAAPAPRSNDMEMEDLT
eukprot:jgi/Mesvir1/4274/Mv22234-RA.1